jgi:hypothetical protein
MGNSITAVIQVYKRPDYLNEMLEALRHQSCPPNNITIVHNEGGVNIDYPKDVHVIYSSENMKYHLRFAIGLLVKTDYIAFLDDDSIPGCKWFENCLQTINKHDCVCVTNGRIVHFNNMSWGCPGWGNPSDSEVECDFGGHSWFLKTKNLKYMWFDDVYEYNNGEDIQLSANCKRFGNIPTFVPPHPTNDKALWGSLKGIEMGADAVASYKVNPVHYQQRWDLLYKYKQLGWKTISNG